MTPASWRRAQDWSTTCPRVNGADEGRAPAIRSGARSAGAGSDCSSRRRPMGRRYVIGAAVYIFVGRRSTRPAASADARRAVLESPAFYELAGEHSGAAVAGAPRVLGSPPHTKRI